MSKHYTDAVAHLHASGCTIIASGTRWRGKQKVAWLFHYEGQEPPPTEHMTLTTAHYKYAPEVVHKVAVFLTPAEIKRRDERVSE